MKYKIITLLLFALASLGMYAQNAAFDRLADMDGVTEVYISKAMLSQMPDIDAEGIDISGIASKLNHMQILTTENPKALASFRSVVASLTSEGYEEYMRIKDGGERMLMYMKEGKNSKSSFVLTVDEKTSYTIISIAGTFTAADLKALTK